MQLIQWSGQTEDGLKYRQGKKCQAVIMMVHNYQVICSSFSISNHWITAASHTFIPFEIMHLPLYLSPPLSSLLWNTDELFPHTDIRISTMLSVSTKTEFAQLTFGTHGFMPGVLEICTAPRKFRLYGSCVGITHHIWSLALLQGESEQCLPYRRCSTGHMFVKQKWSRERWVYMVKMLGIWFSYRVWEILEENEKSPSQVPVLYMEYGHL